MTSLLAGNPKSAPVLLKQGLHPKEKGKSLIKKETKRKTEIKKERRNRQPDRKIERDRETEINE